MPTFGDLLRPNRRAAGLTQAQLAIRAGLSVNGVQKLERGVTHPYRDTVERIMHALQLDAESEVRFRTTIRPVRRRGKSQVREPATEARHSLPLVAVDGISRRESDPVEIRVAWPPRAC